MRRPADPRITLGGPAIIPVAEPPSEPAMPPSVPAPFATTHVSAERLAEALKPLVDQLVAFRQLLEASLPSMIKAFTRMAQAAEEVNRAEFRRRPARTDRH